MEKLAYAEASKSSIESDLKTSDKKVIDLKASNEGIQKEMFETIHSNELARAEQDKVFFSPLSSLSYLFLSPYLLGINCCQNAAQRN